MTPFEQRLNNALSTLFRYTEKLILVAIGGFALVGIGQLVMETVATRQVLLQELLMMFIFIEIMAMANVYFQHRTVPFTYPMLIAVTALARLIVLQGKNSGVGLLYESAALLLVTAAILVLRFSDRYRSKEESEVS